VRGRFCAQVTDPEGLQVWQKDGRSDDKFSYAYTEGDYKYCFERQAQVTTMQAQLDVVTNSEHHAREGETVKNGKCFLSGSRPLFWPFEKQEGTCPEDALGSSRAKYINLEIKRK